MRSFPGSRFRCGAALASLVAALLGACAPSPEHNPETRPPAVAAPTESDNVGTSSFADKTSAPPSSPQALTSRKIILITIDTLRADALAYAGNSRVKTPVLDRLATSSLRFDRAYAHAPMTLPSHASILTGLLPYQHGVRDNGGFVLDRKNPTLATRLKSRGFATAAFVGAFPLDSRYGLDQGFDVYDDHLAAGDRSSSFEMAERSGDRVVDLAVDWWQKQSGAKFLWLHLYDPHAPYAPPEPLRSSYADDLYAGEVTAVDTFLGPLLNPILDEAADGTLVIFTADHGEALGDHGEKTHGLFAYEATIRVPLLVYSPSLRPLRRADSVAHIDIVPTVLQAVGADRDPRLSGLSLMLPAPSLRTIYFEALNATLNRGWAPLRGIVRGADKFISLPLPELYDLRRDPAEGTNLVSTQRATARELAALLPQESAWPPTRQSLSVEEQRRLAALGYLGGGNEATRFGVEDDPKNLIEIDQLTHRFVELYQTRKFSAAEQVARQVVERRPSMGLGYYNLAQVLLDQEKTQEAIGFLQQAVARGIATPGVRRQLALSLASAGRAADGLKVLQPILGSEEPDTLDVYGFVLVEVGAFAQAAAALQRATELDPDHPGAKENLARLGMVQGDWKSAETWARATITLDPNRALAWNYLGIALFNTNRVQEAVDSLQTSVSLAPEDFDVLFNYGLVAAQAGRIREARSALSRFVASAPARYQPDIEKARAILGRMP